MIADTTFLSDFHHELQDKKSGPARRFLASHRDQRLWVTVISAGEIAVIFPEEAAARTYLGRFSIIKNLGLEVAFRAAHLDRELIRRGGRLGENDNWIAAFCLYYSKAIISRDVAFDRVPGLRRVAY